MAASLRKYRGIIFLGGLIAVLLGTAYGLVRRDEYESRAILGVPPSALMLSSMSRLTPLLTGTGLPFTQSGVTTDLLAALVTSPKVLDATLIDTLPQGIRDSLEHPVLTYRELLV